MKNKMLGSPAPLKKQSNITIYQFSPVEQLNNNTKAFVKFLKLS